MIAGPGHSLVRRIMPVSALGRAATTLAPDGVLVRQSMPSHHPPHIAGQWSAYPGDGVRRGSLAIALVLHRPIIEGDPQLRTLKSSRHDGESLTLANKRSDTSNECHADAQNGPRPTRATGRWLTSCRARWKLSFVAFARHWDRLGSGWEPAPTGCSDKHNR